MTSISAVLDAAAIATPVSAPNAAPAAGGASFEAALNQALSGSVTPPTTTSPVPLVSRPEPTFQVQVPTEEELELPSEALGAFLALFLAMAGQALQSADSQETGLQAEAAMAVEGEAATAVDLRAMLESIQQTQATTGETAEEVEEIEALIASLVREAPERTAAPRPNLSNPADDLLMLVDRLTQSISTPSTGTSPASAVASNPDLAPAFEEAVQRLDELAAQAVDLGDALEQVASTAAGLARELSAANGSVVQTTQSTSEASVLGVNAGRVSMADAVEAAKALVQVADLGNGLNLGDVKGRSEISVQLNPGSLGKLHIQLERTSEGVTAKIEASTAAGRAAVEASMSQIQEALGAAGIKVASVEVSGPRTAPVAEQSEVEVTEAVTETKPVKTEARVSEVSQSQMIESSAPVSDAVSADAAISTSTTSVSSATPASTVSRVEVASAPVQAPVVSPEALRLASDIADQVGLLTGQGKSEFNLQLRPESLGRLHMRLTLDDGSVTVRMRTESAETKGMIESNLGQLKQSFSDQGIRVDRFVVEVAQGQFSQQDSQHPRRSRGLADDVPTRRSNGDDEFAEALAAAGGTRPVDYRA